MLDEGDYARPSYDGLEETKSTNARSRSMKALNLERPTPLSADADTRSRSTEEL
jgi:hypothetical protein